MARITVRLAVAALVAALAAGSYELDDETFDVTVAASGCGARPKIRVPPVAPRRETPRPAPRAPRAVPSSLAAPSRYGTAATAILDAAHSEGWAVMFYAPWCGHCQKLAPVWERIDDALDGELGVARVDATAPACAHVAARFLSRGRGYPTIALLRQGRVWYYPQGTAREFDDLVIWARGGYAKVRRGPLALSPSSRNRPARARARALSL